MTVARILDEKGRDVFTTQPHRTLKEVVELLGEKGVGAVVVSDASLSVLGIVSERDVVRVIAKHGAFSGRRRQRDDHQAMLSGRWRIALSDLDKNELDAARLPAHASRPAAARR